MCHFIYFNMGGISGMVFFCLLPPIVTSIFMVYFAVARTLGLRFSSLKSWRRRFFLSFFSLRRCSLSDLISTVGVDFSSSICCFLRSAWWYEISCGLVFNRSAIWVG